MNSTQDRQYAYFAVTSDEPISDHVSNIPLEPSRYWNVGEIVVRGDREFTRRGSRWVIESGLPESEPLEAHIEAVIETVTSVSARLQEFPKHCIQSVVCVAFSVQSSGFVLSPKLLRKISDLGLNLEYDFYSNVDPHDELAELRSLIARDR